LAENNFVNALIQFIRARYIPHLGGREKAMFYNLALNFNGFHASLALTVTMLFIVITLAKERKDERKRA
jgi:hypothetical protein